MLRPDPLGQRPLNPSWIGDGRRRRSKKGTETEKRGYLGKKGGNRRGSR